MEVVDQFLSLPRQGLSGSTLIMGDILLANSSGNGLHQFPGKHANVLVCYADGLYEDLQYRRAIHYYKQLLNVLEQISPFGGDVKPQKTDSSVPSDAEVKWKLYRCHMHLKENQEALDVLSSIVIKERDAKVAMALAKLYHHYKNESRCAIICYKQALSMNPLAIEAALGLFSLGVSLTEVLKSIPTAASNLYSLPWLKGWLEAQFSIARHDYKGAVVILDELSKLGFCLSADMSCQLAWCMEKLERRTASEELFATAQAKDPFILKHMDTYSRLLASSSSSKKLDMLSVSLLYTSPLHPEPWVARAWHVIRCDGVSTSERLKTNALLAKACSLSSNSAEASYLQASVALMKNDESTAIHKLSEAVHLDPTMFVAYEDLIRCYLSMRSEKEALNMARMASKSLQQQQVLYLQSLVFSQNSSTKHQAVLALERAMKMDATFEKAPLALSSFYMSEGKAERAVKVLTEHLKSYASPSLYCEVGQHLITLQRYQEALEQFRQALRLDGSFEKAVKGIEYITSKPSDGGGGEGEDKATADGQPSEFHLEQDEDTSVPDNDDSTPLIDLGAHDYQWM